MEEEQDKIILATRTKIDSLDRVVEKVKLLAECKLIYRSYIICNKKLENGKFSKDIELIFDTNPTRSTAFNLIINELRNNNNQYHLLTFSEEVELSESNIKAMYKEIEGDQNLIAAGYDLRDNILTDEEYELYSNSLNGRVGIAYLVPWSTCCLWNKEFIYNNKGDFFDRICEKNQLGKLFVKINNKDVETEYEGMEDGLAIARLISQNPDLSYRRLNKILPWNITGDGKRIEGHRKKMARKNIALSAFMGIKGYSIDALAKAGERGKAGILNGGAHSRIGVL